MLSKLKQNGSMAAFALAVVALFVAIGGVAGALPGKNGVNSGDIKNNSVKSADIKDDGVTGKDVKESTLQFPASSKDVFGATVSPTATVDQATLPGTTAVKTDSSTFSVTFPHSVSGCTPVANLDGDAGPGDAGAKISGPNSVRAITFSGMTGVPLKFNLVVVC